MKYTAQEVIQYVEEENVKFIRLAFCDVYGRQKNISIMDLINCSIVSTYKSKIFLIFNHMNPIQCI